MPLSFRILDVFIASALWPTISVALVCYFYSFCWPEFRVLFRRLAGFAVVFLMFLTVTGFFVYASRLGMQLPSTSRY